MTHTKRVTLALWLGFWIRLEQTVATAMTGTVTRYKHKAIRTLSLSKAHRIKAMKIIYLCINC